MMDDEMKFCITILIIVAIVARKEIAELYCDIKHLIKSREDKWK